jgi:Flp pilus assembly protein TadG
MMQKCPLPRRFRNVREETGAALVELALVSFVLVVVMVGTIDLGRVFYTAMVVTNAARAGAMYGAQSVGTSGNTSAMESAALAVLGANGLGGSAPLCDTNIWPQCATQSCFCVNDAGDSWAPGACAPSPCTGATHQVVSATVNVTRTFSMVSPFPGLPSTVTISRSHTARAQ